MSGRVTPTICDPKPGFGLRVRFDHPRALPVADADCRCGTFAESAVGEVEVQRLVIRFERHARDECPLPEVRAAAATRDWRRRNPTTRRK